MTQEQLREVEDLVNTWVGQAHALEVEEMPIAEAKAKGAIAMFGERCVARQMRERAHR